MFSNPALRLRAPATRQSVRLSLRQQHSSPLSSAHSPIKASRLPSKAAIVNQSKSIFSDARAFHSSASRHGIMPDSADPTPPEPEAHQVVAKEPTDISYEEYHQHADAYLHDLVDRLEQEQEKRQDVEVDYSAGVLEIAIASKGTYVLNKQPPNKQIWLSSPLSGPKRFDWVVMGESMNQKEGAGVGDWIYLRDGTSLTNLIKKELGVELGVDQEVVTRVSG